MAIDSWGYDGTVNETQWADVAPVLGTSPALFSPDNGAPGLGLTVKNAANRTATLGPGWASGWGVVDHNKADFSLTFDADSGATPRWDAVCLHRDWTVNETSITIVKGEQTADPQLPNALDATPGTTADHVVWLVAIDPTGIVQTVHASPYTGGAPLYYPAAPGANQFLNARNYPYGALVVQYTSNGQPRLYSRQGGVGSAAKFVNIMDPPWTDMNLPSSITSITVNRKARARLFCGHLELRGTIVPVGGDGTFKVGGGVDGNFDLWHVPSDMRPSATRATGVTRNKGNIDIIYDTSTNILYAYVWNNNVDAIPLDGLRLPL